MLAAARGRKKFVNVNVRGQADSYGQVGKKKNLYFYCSPSDDALIYVCMCIYIYIYIYIYTVLL